MDEQIRFAIKLLRWAGTGIVPAPDVARRALTGLESLGNLPRTERARALLAVACTGSGAALDAGACRLAVEALECEDCDLF